MQAIVAVCRDWGIGKGGKLLLKNKADMRFFVEKTYGHTVVMGRKTFESIPGHKPLKNRRNIILTRNEDFYAEGFEIMHSKEELLAKTSGLASDELWLIGGAELYKLLLDDCSSIFVTKNDCVVPADTYFPNLDEDARWEPHRLGIHGTSDAGVPFEIFEYRHKACVTEV